MLTAKLIHSLPQLTPPILSVYLDTNPAEARNQGHTPGYLIWLKSRARVIGARAPRAEQKLFKEQMKRVEDYLRNQRPGERGVAIFAGPYGSGPGQARTWELLPLGVEVEDELHWGAASLTQLVWLLDEHQACGAVVVDRSGARFFRFWLGEAEEEETAALRLDSSKWRGKELAAPSHPGSQKTRGPQRDVFEQRVEAQYARFYREAGERIRQWAEREKLEPVMVAGPSEVAEAVWAELPKSLQERAALMKAELGHLSAAELHARLEPELTRWKREHELGMVERMLGAPNGVRAVMGMDETLARLQEGGARELVVARGLGGKLRQCAKCGWVDRAADRVCATCGGERRVVALRAVVPELARRYGVTVEVVAGEAGRKLREAGGMGAWLR